jgi:hypothetical protein
MLPLVKVGLHFLLYYLYRKMVVKPYSIISACLLIVCAAIVQAIQGYPDAFSVSFLLLGVTSVIHHCRLDEWWKHDIWRLFDYLAIAAFAIIAINKFRSVLVWFLLCMLVLPVTCLIWCGAIGTPSIPVAHAFIHGILCLCVFYLITLEQYVSP